MDKISPTILKVAAFWKTVVTKSVALMFAALSCKHNYLGAFDKYIILEDENT